MPDDPQSLLRQAAEVAPSVLPAGAGDAAATLFDLLRQWAGVPSTVAAGGEALAREVLALAEQQQAPEFPENPTPVPGTPRICWNRGEW